MKHDWEYKKLGEMFQTSSGGTPSKNHNEYYEGGNIPWLRSGEVSQGDIYESEMFITQEGLDNSSAKIFPCNTVVIAMYGATVGQVGILRNEMSTNQAICGIFPSVSYKPEFLKFVLSAQKSNYLKVAVGGAQPNISQQIIKDTLIPIPPLPTQQSIVSELDSLSKIIADCKETLKDYDALEQSIFYDMFGDPVKNDKGWEFVPFESVTSSMTKGPFGSDIKKSLYVPKSEDTYKVYIQVNAINNDASLGDYYISKEYFEEKMFRFEVKPNDYLITCDGTLGKFIRLPEKIEKGIISASLLRVTLNDKIEYEYFESLWNQYMLGELIKDVRNAALKHLPSASNIGKLCVPLPPLPLQQQFASKIEAIENMKSETKKALQEAETLFNARMDYWFN